LNNQFLAGPDTFGAQYAFAQITFEEGIDFFNRRHAGNPLQLY